METVRIRLRRNKGEIMNQKKNRNKSIWECQLSKPNFPAIMKDLESEITVVGAGMSGILTAYLLKQFGYRVIVVEANQVGSGATHNTTAKITSQHNAIYADMIEDFGFDKAREYAMSNQAAIEQYEMLIKKLQIDCDFKKEEAYIYSINHPEILMRETEAAKSLGLPASFTTETALPFKVAGAVCFKNQASFHPLKFLYAISKELEIYEHSKVTKVIGDHELEIEVEHEDKGVSIHHIKSKYIVITTHYPFMNFPGFYFTKMHQERSYVVAAKAPDALPYGMYISLGETGYSFRKYGDYLLLGGFSHRTGQQTDKEHFKPLLTAVKRYYNKPPIVCWWANQDCAPIDGIPYIGTYSAGNDQIFVATGFNKWGMTTSMVAAMYLSNMIAGKEKYEDSIYNPRRFNLQASKKLLKTDIKVTTSRLTLQKIYRPKKTLKEIKPGFGGIVTYQGKKVGVYRTNKGVVYMVSTKCPHLGCMLEWNQEERSWDCPCHGSRFDFRGNLINNPAQEGIAYK